MSGWRKEGGSNPAPRVGVMGRVVVVILVLVLVGGGGMGEWEWRKGDFGGNGGDVA